MLVVKEIQEYAQVRTKARAYLCYIMSRNISQSMGGETTLESVITRIDKLKEALPSADVIYAIDGNGIQMVDNNFTTKGKLKGFGKGEDRSDRAYYYKTIKEHRCMLTDPYPVNDLQRSSSHSYFSTLR